MTQLFTIAQCMNHFKVTAHIVSYTDQDAFCILHLPSIASKFIKQYFIPLLISNELYKYLTSTYGQ